MERQIKQSKSATLKQAFGQDSTNKAIVGVKQDTIVPISNLLSHKYTFILESIIDIKDDFSIADYTDNNGLFACLLAQDFEDANCYFISKKDKTIDACKQVKKAFDLTNVSTKKANILTTKQVTDISLHETPTIHLLKKNTPAQLAENIAKKTRNLAIVEIPSQSLDIETKKELGKNFQQVELFFTELFKHFLMVTYVPVIYKPDIIRAYYLLEKRKG